MLVDEEEKEDSDDDQAIAPIILMLDAFCMEDWPLEMLPLLLDVFDPSAICDAWATAAICIWAIIEELALGTGEEQLPFGPLPGWLTPDTAAAAAFIAICMLL